MARKKKTQEDAEAASPSSNDSASSHENTKDEGAEMVTIIKTGMAPKLSPRGDGQLTYQISRSGSTVLVRIFHNESSGRFSKEWVTVAAIREALARLPKGANSFKGALALRGAWVGLSSCNVPFGAAVLRAEGIFVSDEDPKKKGMLKLATPDALNAWEKAMLALPVLADAESVLRHPPRPVPHFAIRDAKPETEVAAPEAAPLDSVEEEDATLDGDEE